jgi:hypothetical protein
LGRRLGLEEEEEKEEEEEEERKREADGCAKVWIGRVACKHLCAGTEDKVQNIKVELAPTNHLTSTSKPTITN